MIFGMFYNYYIQITIFILFSDVYKICNKITIKIVDA